MSTALATARDQADALRARLRSVRERSKQEGANMLQTGVAVATGYGLGMAEAKWGEDSVAGMSPSLALGVVATGAALLELGGSDVAPYARSVGNAALAVFAHSKGFEHQQARDQAA